MEVRMSLADASALLKVAPNTIRSRFKAGKIKGERDNTGKIWVWIDPNIKGSKKPISNHSSKGSNDAAVEALNAQLEQANTELKDLRQKAARADLLEAEKVLLLEKISDLKDDRDAWRRLSERRGFLGLFRR